MTNNSWSVFSDVEILSMAHLQLSSGKQILIGFKSVRGSIMPRMITTTVPILRSVYALHTPPRVRSSPIGLLTVPGGPGSRNVGNRHV